MLFRKDLIDKILAGEKTQTRRLWTEADRLCGTTPAVQRGLNRIWRVGQRLSVQPGRGKKSVAHVEVYFICLEELQAIDDDGCRAEGVADRAAFAKLWDEINAKPGSRWEDNPLVWVLCFHRIQTDVALRGEECAG